MAGTCSSARSIAASSSLEAEPEARGLGEEDLGAAARPAREAREGLEADDASGAELHDRLEERLQRALVEDRADGLAAVVAGGRRGLRHVGRLEQVGAVDDGAHLGGGRGR